MKGCHSIWSVTRGSVASFTACSRSSTVKFETPMCFAKPSRFIRHSAPMVSASGMRGFGQWISSRSTSESLSLARLSLVARSNSRGARWSGHTFVVTNTCARGTPDDAQPLADLALVAVHLGGVDVAVAEAQRLLDHPHAGALAQIPRPEADRGNACAIGFDERGGHGTFRDKGSSSAPPDSACLPPRRPGSPAKSPRRRSCSGSQRARRDFPQAAHAAWCPGSG